MVKVQKRPGPKQFWRVLTITMAIGALAGSPAGGQDVAKEGGPAPSYGEGRETVGPSAPDVNNAAQQIKRFAGDERDLWTSTGWIRAHDAKWLLMLGATAAGLVVADHAIMQHNTLSPANVTRSAGFSNCAVGALAGVGGALYLWGRATGDDHQQETGLLSGESALNAFLASTAIGYVVGRERPNVDAAQGRFFQGGKSFPSDHSAVAWSIASIIAHEYPGPLTKLFAYGFAGAVSVSRVTGDQHFPSDVLVGGAMGWLISRDVYQKRHSPNLAGAAWVDPSVAGQGAGNRHTVASPYVPLDSWIYPDLDRLEALGYVRSGFMGMRPWTRKECARLLEEAGEALRDAGFQNIEASRIYDALAHELSPELNPGDEAGHSVRAESLYTRLMGISGQPLNDSYHFGQTLINDFGRPYQEGFDPVSGFSGWGNWGRFALYMRGEYQHSPSAPEYPQSVHGLIAQLDGVPVQPASPVLAINRFTLLDTYALTKIENWDFSFGKQSLWWGPNQGGSLLLSDNAEPIYMFRVARDTPFTLPGIFQNLGAVKLDAFMGKISGNQFPPRPLFHGEKISLKPTDNLEISFSRTAEFGGVGRPLTLGALFYTYLGLHPSERYSNSQNPGQRNGGFDFSYRVPRLRNWLTVYSNLMSRDDVTPLVALFPVRALLNPGVYLARMPHIHRLDLRAEAVTTIPPNAQNKTGHFAYWDTFYRHDYINKNNLIADWIGRAGTGYQGWSTYWFSPRTTLQVGYRHAQVSSAYIPQGETLNDGSVKFNYQIGSALSLTGFVQYENWLVPVLAPRAKNNVTTALQMTFWPQTWGRRN